MFRIRFRGLLTHTALTGRQFVVLIRDARHRALLTVRNEDIIRTSTPPPETWDGPGVTCYSLVGTIRLDGIERGPVEVNLNGVPKLTEISDGRTVHRNVIHRTPSPDFLGFFDLDGGTLSIEDWYEQHVTFDGAILRCLPRTIMYGVSATADAVHFRIDGRYVAINPDAEVLFTNVDFFPPPSPMPPPPNEYGNYIKFFTDATFVQYPVESPHTFCPFGTKEVPRAQCKTAGNLGVRCSNNQYP